MSSKAFHDAANFAFTRTLESRTEQVAAELAELTDIDFIESPDSLTTIRDGYDETGWHYYDLFGEDPEAFADHRIRCPQTAEACAAVPGLVNAGFSKFRSGTSLYPHHGERSGVLRCHLPIVVPAGDLGIRAGEETRVWRRGECLIFDDTFEHVAWNRTGGDRVVLLITFRA